MTDRSGRHNLADLRALQDWFLKYELKSVLNVAKVASVGGMVRQYQVCSTRTGCAPTTCRRVVEAIRRANEESGGSVLELGEAEYMVRSSAYLKSLDDFSQDSAADHRRRRLGAPARRGP